VNDTWQGAGRRILMQEVGPRDGLQVEAAFVPTEDKIALVNALSDAGLAKIEVTAFVSPKAIPALRNPTISPLSNDAWVALETIIDESVVREIIPQLKAMGAEGIVEYPLNKVVY
jgi:ATP phosphoribosyltransferase-like protein